jgi:hypothetical protein
MRYRKEHFANLPFNPMVKGKMLQEYPNLSEVVKPEWYDEPLLDNIIRYVIMVYDPKSILVINDRDLNYRKGIAAELSGFDLSDDTVMQDIYSCRNIVVLEFTVKYLMRFPRSKEWAAIVAFEYKFWESIKKIMQPIGGTTSDIAVKVKNATENEELEAVKKKAAISDEIDKDITRLDKYYKLFFGEDDELEKAAKHQAITPELIAGIR